mgnify:FL=1
MCVCVCMYVLDFMCMYVSVRLCWFCDGKNVKESLRAKGIHNAKTQSMMMLSKHSHWECPIVLTPNTSHLKANRPPKGELDANLSCGRILVSRTAVLSSFWILKISISLSSRTHLMK